MELRLDPMRYPRLTIIICLQWMMSKLNKNKNDRKGK